MHRPERNRPKLTLPALLLFAAALLPTAVPAAVPESAAQNGTSAPVRFADDPRLDQKVSLTAWSEPLEDVLARLTRETGVSLLFEGRDVGDQRVNVLLKAQPLRRAQALLAEVLDFTWRRERRRSGWRYLLCQDLRGHKREEELRARAHERFEDGVRQLLDSLKLTPPEIEKLRAVAPWWAVRLTEPGRRRAVELVSRLAPSRWEELMRTGRIEIPYARLSPADQERVRQYVEVSNMDRDQRDRERGTPGLHHMGDVTRPGGKVAIIVFGGVPAGPDSSFDFSVEPAEGHWGGHGIGLGFTEEQQRLLLEEFTPPGFEKEKRAPSGDAEPRITVTWKEKPVRWEEVLKTVAKAADLQLVSDSFLYHWWEENMNLPDSVALQERPLAEILDKVSAPFFYVWRRDGDVTLFRNRNGFLEKPHNVPERDLRRWREHLETRGRLDLDDLAEIALLTRRQLRLVEGAHIPIDSAAGHKPLLRLYAALTPVQREHLERTGLRATDVSAAQTDLLRTWKPAVTVSPDTRLRLRREPDAVVFTLATEGSAPEEERVPLPRRSGK